MKKNTTCSIFSKAPSTIKLFFLPLLLGCLCLYSCSDSGGSGSVVREIVYTGVTTPGDYDSKDIYLMDLNGENRVQLTDNNIPEDMPLWSPDGKYILFSANLFSLYRMDSRGRSVTEITEVLAGLNSFCWSPDSLSFFYAEDDGSSDIFISSHDLKQKNNLTNTGDDDEYSPSVSPDGTKIAYLKAVGGNYDLYIMNSDGSGQTLLSEDIDDLNKPVWSPDGEALLFVSGSKIYSIKPDGSDEERLTTDGGTENYPSFSSDGSLIAYSLDRNIFTIKPDGTNQQQLTDNALDNIMPRFAPGSSETIFYLSNISLVPQIYRIKSDGTEEPVNISDDEIEVIDFDIRR